MSNATFREPARDLPVDGAWDVVVVGGGLAGVAAAVAAARRGVSVLLIDKGFALGGLATLGNVTVWLPLCDGHGRQVTAGLAEELLKLSVADLGADRPAAGMHGAPGCWQPGGDGDERRRHRYLARFNPSSYLLALEPWLLAAGVELWYDTRLCAVARDSERLSHLIVENKDGRRALEVGVVIDATGDADVCHLAGESTESLDSNVLCGWYYVLDSSGLRLHAMSHDYSPLAQRQGAVGPFYRGDVAAEVTAQLLGSRQKMRDQMAGLRANQPDDDAQLLLPPTIPCFRMTRRLVGRHSLADSDRHTWFDDTIGLISDWRRPGPVWAIAYRHLLGTTAGNLLVAGRCTSADTTVWDVTRALPGVCVSGEAAGAGAALAVRGTRGEATGVPVEDLRSTLADHGVLLDPALLAPSE